ncbi:MAG TPA: hypothetical protein VJP07_11225 [Dehalococcoidia bacterium]|nr:hypothetical protein [Dehalococcoidia bacterium]
MATQNDGINLFDQEPDERDRKDSKRTAFALGALAALGVAGALGVGFVLGGGNSSGGEVKGDTSEPTRVVRLSPTPSNPQTGGQDQPQAPAGNTQSGASDSGDNGSTDGGSMDAGDSGSEPPAPTNTPEPPAPTETPVPPTETPTSTPTATATPSGAPCPWCPDLDLVDPGIIIDLFPPQFDYANAMNCPAGTLVGASVNEEAEMWVTYTVLGLFDSESEHMFDVNVAIFNIGGGPFIFPAGNIVVHARDAMGNESSQATDWMGCA